MRVIAGTLKNSRIMAPAGRHVRPSSARQRGVIFDILAHIDWAPALVGVRVLDLFAGSGALAIEALSRGAALAYCCDTSPEARRAIADNAQTLGLCQRLLVSGRDATRLGKRPPQIEPFALAFLDPPYGRNLAEPALAEAARQSWLCSGAIAVIETAATDALPEPEQFSLMTERHCGSTRLAFMRLDA